ncbi:MAG: zinc ABC transporter substrate-binding protein [Thermoguttaceae bacterium]|jgi:zinc transport system substrate-binding protein
MSGRWLAATVAMIAALGGLAVWRSGVATGSRPGAETQAAGHSLAVFAGIAPLAGLVERVGGAHVEVNVLVQPGQNEHVFEPPPRLIVQLSKATLFFKVGLPLEERLVERIAANHPNLSVIDTARGIRKRPMDEDLDEDEHEETGRQGEPDPHVWMSPANLKIMAANVSEALCRADPAHAGDYRKNLAALAAELDAVDARLTRALTPYRGQSFYVFHPAFGYLADAYGLKQQAVELGGKSPTPRQLRRLIARARAERVRIVFVQPQFDPRGVQAVAEAIGGTVRPLDPLAKDVVANLDDLATKIAEALASEKPAARSDRKMM